MIEPFTVSVTTIYALSMAKIICLRIRGNDQEVRVKADVIERDGDKWLLKRDGQQVGLFWNSEVQGWYIIDDKRED